MDVEKLSKEIQDVVPAPSIKHAVSSDAEDTMVNDAAQSEQATAIHLSCIGWRPSKQEWMIFAPLMVISVMVSLDATIIITPLPTIAQALHASATASLWVGTSYLLVSAVTMSFVASLSDIFGRPLCLTLSILIFTIGSVVCATATTIYAMLVGRSVQGLGGGGIIILSLVIITDIVPLRFRPRYTGIIQGSWALGTCAGPVIGGALATASRWRWIFYLMLPFGGLGAISVPLMVRLKSRKTPTSWQADVARVDLVGASLFVASASVFLVAISRGGTQVPWSSSSTVGPLVGGSLGLVITVFWEKFAARHPFLKGSLFYGTTVSSIYAGAFAQGFLVGLCLASFCVYAGSLTGLELYGQLYYCPLFFASVKLYHPLRTGVSLLPVMLTLTPTSVGTGLLITRWGRYRWAVWSGWALVTVAGGVMIGWNADTALGHWISVLSILGVGHGLLLTALNCASQAAAPPGEEHTAAATYVLFRSLGMAMGVGISASVFENVMRAKIVADDVPADVIANAAAYITTLQAMAPSRSRDAIIQVYTSGFHGTWTLFCAFGALALGTSLFVRHADMNKDLDSDHVIIHSRDGLNSGPE